MAHIINIPLPNLEYIAAAKNEIYKWGEVNKDDSNFMKIYHLQVDSLGNMLDNTILESFCKERIEKLKLIVAEYLTDVENYEATFGDKGYLAENLELTLPQGWNVYTWSALRNHVNEYIIQGIVADWYGNVGIDSRVFDAKALSESQMVLTNIYSKNVVI